MSSFSAAVRGCCCCCSSSSLRSLLGSSRRRDNCKKLLKNVVSWRNRWYTHKADGLGEKPGLKEFINAAVAHGVSSTGDRVKEEEDDIVPYLTPAVVSGQNRRGVCVCVCVWKDLILFLFSVFWDIWLSDECQWHWHRMDRAEECWFSKNWRNKSSKF